MRRGGWAFLVLLLLAATPEPGWSEACCGAVPVTQMTSPQGPSWIRPALAADDLGGVVAAWTRADEGLIVSASQDDGETWRPPLAFDPPSQLFDLAVSPTGHVLVCWTSEMGDVWCARSADQGLSLGPPAPVGFGATDDWFLRPSVSIAASGLAIVAWSDGDSLYAACSTDFGAVWQPPVVVVDRTLDWIVTGPFGDQSFSGAFEAIALEGAAALAYTVRSPVDSTFHIVRTDGTCGAWLPPESASDVPISTSDGLRLATTDGSDIVAAWHARPAAGFETRTRTWLSLGASPQPEVVLGAVQSSHAIALATDGDGRVAVVWVDDSLASRLQVSSDRGLPGSWRADPALFAEEGDASQWHVVTMQAGGPIHVAWADFRSADACGNRCEDIYLNVTCDDGETWWSEDLRLDSDDPPWGMVSYWPALAIGASERIHAAWGERGSGSGTGAIHYEGLDPAEPVLRGAAIDGTLQVARSGEGVSLTWTDGGVATAFNVYVGSLSGLHAGRGHDHAAAACHVARSAGPPDGSVTLAPLGSDATMLVVPASCDEEGGAGADSLGGLRPVSPSGPPCGPAP